MNKTFWTMAYKFGWSDIEGLRQATAQNLITADDFFEITGERYEVVLPDGPPTEFPKESFEYPLY